MRLRSLQRNRVAFSTSAPYFGHPSSVSGLIYLIERMGERVGAVFFTDPLLESAPGNYRTGLNFRDLMN
jgi:hypothetical protein